MIMACDHVVGDGIALFEQAKKVRIFVYTIKWPDLGYDR